MYVWRLPLFAFATIAATAVLVVFLGGLLWIRSRVLSSVLAVAALLAGPFIVYGIINAPLEASARLGHFIHPPRFIFWLPSLAALCIVYAARALFPASIRYRVYFAATILFFSVLNFANGCSPGWCERFGIPFAWSWWSDSILIMNGRNWSAGTSVAAAIADAAVAIAACAALVYASRRR